MSVQALLAAPATPAAPRARAGTLAPAAMTGFPQSRYGGSDDGTPSQLSVALEAHVAQRAGSKWRPSPSARARLLFELFATLEVALALAWAIATGVLLGFYPGASFLRNAAWRWTAFAASLSAAMVPLRAAESLLFLGVARLEEAIKDMERNYAERHLAHDRLAAVALRLVDAPRFMLPLKGHLSHIAIAVVALLSKEFLWEIQMDASANFYFQRTCGFLLAIKIGLAVKGVALEVVSRMLALAKHGEAVQQCTFTEEVLCCLSAPPPTPTVELEEWPGDPRRALWATLLLEGGSFTMQAHSLSIAGLHCFVEEDEEGGEPLLFTDPVFKLRPVTSETGIRECALAAYGRIQTYLAQVAALGESERLERSRAALLPRRASDGDLASPSKLLKKAIGHLRVTAGAGALAAAAPKRDVGLTAEALLPFFLNDPERAAAAWAHLAHSGSSKNNPEALSREEFVTACVRMFAAYTSVRKSLESNESLSQAIRVLASGVFWVALFLIGLGLYGIDFSAVLVPILTLTVSFAFALGPFIQRFLDVRALASKRATRAAPGLRRPPTLPHAAPPPLPLPQSLLFTLVHSPFDPGDRVIIDGGATLAVKSMNLLTSEFTVLSTNQHLTRRNADLLGASIVNLRKSARASFSITFAVDHRASAKDLAAVEERLQAWLGRDEGKWVGGSATLNAAHAERNRVDITVGASSHVSWMEGAKVAQAQRELVMALVAALRDLNVEFSEASLQAPQKRGGADEAAAAAARPPPLTAPTPPTLPEPPFAGPRAGGVRPVHLSPVLE